MVRAAQSWLGFRDRHLLYFLYNVAWLWIAANSIRTADPQEFVERARGYVISQPTRDFILSPAVIDAFENSRPTTVACRDGFAGLNPDKAGVIMLAREHSWHRWVANRPGFVERTISSWEVNYDYYPTWYGRHRDRRIVVLTLKRALLMKVEFEGFRRCSVGT